MDIETTPLKGVLIVTPRRFVDERGFFSEVWNKRDAQKAGLTYEFVQDSQSISAQAGTIRGLHFQAPPHAQDKLVRCGQGALLDVAVDIRKSSATFGQSICVELSAENGRQLFVPKGFLHGFVTLKSNTEMLYKCTDFYAPASDGAVHFASDGLGIDWGIDPSKAIVSDKDANAIDFAQFESPFE